ncbi:Uncharacterised protein [Vibrio cholerae]|nr:Uncharacterised protein [Vibrio cholerae]
MIGTNVKFCAFSSPGTSTLKRVNLPWVKFRNG